MTKANKREKKRSGEPGGEVAVEGLEGNPACPQCGWRNTRLSHTRTLFDGLLRAFSLRAFRCRSCGNRFRAICRTSGE